MLSQYFGFQEDPFGSTPDPRYLYPSETHREAMASLKYGFFSNRGFTAMIAPPGMGKTTLLFRFLEDIRETSRSIFLFDIDPGCEPREFVGYILRDLGITPGKGSAEMHQQLSEALVRETRAGRKFVIVIDEAQNLSDAVLERVRLLTNFETTRGKLMQIVLSGQPQLSDKLMQPSLLQLRQRISTICRIEPLSAEETIAYIGYRLKQAGYDGEPLFTNDALKLITEASQGTPRTINNLCFNALSLCRALNRKQVDGTMVSEVIADLQLTPQSKKPTVAVEEAEAKQASEPQDRKLTTRLLRRWVLSTAVVIVICVLCALGLTQRWVPQIRKVIESRFLNLKVQPASASTTATESTAKAVAPEPELSTKPFEITVEPDQKLQDISMQYLGGYDLQRLHRIQALNPKLTDPDHIEAGQKIWLPGPPPVSAAKNASPRANERKLP
jgi:type II secretory pathway predicted ATPase ExeA